MTTRYITLSVGTSNVKATSMTTMQTFIEIKQFLKVIKLHFKSHMMNRSYTRDHFALNLLNSPNRACLINSI